MGLAALMGGCGKPDFDDPKLLDKIIAQAVDINDLQTRDGPDQDWELFYEKNKQTPYSGWVKQMHSDGRVWGLAQVKDGLKHGVHVTWYENGQKAQELKFKDANMHGSMTEWYENGQKKVIWNYKDGKRHGSSTQWYENGQKLAEVNYKDDSVDGFNVTFHENGQKKAEFTYKDGKEEGLARKWNEDGKLTREATYKNGELISDKSL